MPPKSNPPKNQPTTLLFFLEAIIGQAIMLITVTIKPNVSTTGFIFPPM